MSNDEKASMTFKVVRVLFGVLCAGSAAYAMLVYLVSSKIHVGAKDMFKGFLPLVLLAFLGGIAAFDFAAKKWKSYKKPGGE